MTSIDVSKILRDIEAIVREAGTVVKERFENPNEANLKSSAVDLVTETDKYSEQLIVSRLQELYPDFPLMGEEGGDYQNGTTNESPYLWVIDPIDGTTNFAHHIPHFCINIALLDSKSIFPLVAVSYDPMRDELFAGIRGQGATLNGKPLQVTQATKLAQSVVASGFPYTKWIDPDNNADHWGHFVVRSRGVRRMGAAGLDVAWVAAGRFDGYWEHNVSIWDVAPGILFLIEAGGKITAYDGSELPFQTKKMRILVSNGSIHQEMSEVLIKGDAAPRP